MKHHSKIEVSATLEDAVSELLDIHKDITVGRLHTMTHIGPSENLQFLRADDSRDWILLSEIEREPILHLEQIPENDHLFHFVWTDDAAGEVTVHFADIGSTEDESRVYDTSVEAHNGDCWSPFYVAWRTMFATIEAVKLLREHDPECEFTQNDF